MHASTKPAPRHREHAAAPLHKPRAQRGVTLLIVLLIMAAMIAGGVALARLTEVGTLATGNSAFHTVAVQASEVALNTAYKDLKDLADPGADNGGWYRARTQTTDAAGVPDVDFDAAPELVVGAYSLRYVVERLCTVAAVTEPLNQCLLDQLPSDESRSGTERPDPVTAIQYRITVRVDGPKGTRTWTQALARRG